MPSLLKLCLDLMPKRCPRFVAEMREATQVLLAAKEQHV
jgi:hypothetical protein